VPNVNVESPASALHERTVAHRLVGTLVILACAVMNSSFLVANLVGGQLNWYSSFVSEYGARGEPGALFFHLSDFITGCLLLAAMFQLWRVFPQGWAVRIGQIALITVGILTTADAFLPLDCVPTADPSCRARETANLVTWAHETHGFTGVLESACITAALILFWWGMHSDPVWHSVRRWSLAFGVVYLIGNLVIVAQYMLEIGGLGVTQRCQVLAFSGFLIALGICQFSITAYSPESQRATNSSA
jgi:hypothetical protein